MRKYKSIYKEAPRIKKNNLEEGKPFYKFESQMENIFDKSLSKIIHLECIYDGNNTMSYNAYITDDKNKVIDKDITYAPSNDYSNFVIPSKFNKINNQRLPIDFDKLKTGYDTKKTRNVEIYLNMIQRDNPGSIDLYDLMFVFRYENRKEKYNKYDKMEMIEMYKYVKTKTYLM